MELKTSAAAVLRSPKTRRWSARTAIAVVLFGVVGFFVVSPLVKSILVDKLAQALHRPVAIDSIRINPYALSATVEGFSVLDKAGGEPVAGFDSLYVNLESSSLLHGGPVLSEIRLEGAKVKLVRLPGNRYNFSDLIDEFLAQPESPTPAFSLNNIHVSGGRIDFEDKPNNETHVVSAVDLKLPFLSSLPSYSQIDVEPAFSAVIDGAPLALTGRTRPFDDSRESELVLAVDNLQLAKYLDYSPVPLPIKIVSGTLDSNLKLVFREQNSAPSTLTLSGKLALRQLAVNEANDQALVRLKGLEVAVKSADLVQRKIEVERVDLESPQAYVRVSPQGAINWLALMPKPALAGEAREAGEAKAAAPFAWTLHEAQLVDGALHWQDDSRGAPQRATLDRLKVVVKKLASHGESPATFDLSWRVDAGERLRIDESVVRGGRLNLARRDVQIQELSSRGLRAFVTRLADGGIEWLKPPALPATQVSPSDKGAAWKVTLAKLRLEDFGARFEDKATTVTAVQALEDFSLNAENLSTVADTVTRFSTRFRLNRNGEVQAEGTAKPGAREADVKLDVKGVELLPLQPYFSEKLNVTVTRGQLAASGAVQLRRGADGGLGGAFRGQLTVGDFTSVDKASDGDFLKWKSFYFGNIDARLNPFSLSLGEVALSDFFARVVVTPEGKLNLLRIVRGNDESAPVAGNAGTEKRTPALAATERTREGEAKVPLAAVEKAVPPVKIGKVTLQGGTVSFTDNFVKPNYSAKLTAVGGRVTGLSSAADSVADVELRGSYDNAAPLNIRGRINPLAAKPSLDLQAEVKGIELTSLTTYAAKYAGYAIDKGKLSLFVKYKIENQQLVAENRIFLDQLTFGQAVDSPSATKLPVTLAVALLKNRAGEIDINLPISGSLDDPQFSLGGVIVKVIVNLFVKAVTSPFALLGSLFSGGEEFSNVEFDYGHATLPASALKKLESLAKALLERPALRLEIDGRVDMERDREGLKHALMERKVRSLKHADLLKRGVEAGSVRDVVIDAKEYPALLERVYRDEKFPKPRNLVGMVKGLPVEEMEKLMLAHTQVSEEELRDLADRRAKAVRDWLVNQGQVPTERVFLLPPRLGSTDDQPGSKASATAKDARADFSLK